MPAKVFVDSNIWLYSLIQRHDDSRHDAYALNYWDSLIVAAALDAGCTRLYSEDMQHGQVFEQCLTVTNPFQSS